MNSERQLDAAIGLLGLGEVYRHRTSNEGQCCRCGLDPKQDRICYAEVPNFGEDIGEASRLLARIWKEADLSLSFNTETQAFEISYGKTNTNARGMLFWSKKPAKAIKCMALYHYNIEPKVVIKGCQKDCCVVNQ